MYRRALWIGGSAAAAAPNRDPGGILIEPAIDEMHSCSGLPDWDPIAVNPQGRSEQEQESSTTIC